MKDFSRRKNSWGGGRRHLVRRHRVTNGCEQPVFRHEMSCGRVLGAVGNDAASLAQLKCAGGGEMVCFWVFWGKHGRCDRTWGCSEGSGRVCHHFRAVEGGPGWDRAGDAAVIDDDVAGCVDA